MSDAFLHGATDLLHTAAGLSVSTVPARSYRERGWRSPPFGTYSCSFSWFSSVKRGPSPRPRTSGFRRRSRRSLVARYVHPGA